MPSQSLARSVRSGGPSSAATTFSAPVEHDLALRFVRLLEEDPARQRGPLPDELDERAVTVLVGIRGIDRIRLAEGQDQCAPGVAQRFALVPQDVMAFGDDGVGDETGVLPAEHLLAVLVELLLGHGPHGGHGRQLPYGGRGEGGVGE
nr:hypothetical protein OG461_06965 [Streptomyces sp. NBC_00995]